SSLRRTPNTGRGLPREGSRMQEARKAGTESRRALDDGDAGVTERSRHSATSRSFARNESWPARCWELTDPAQRLDSRTPKAHSSGRAARIIAPVQPLYCPLNNQGTPYDSGNSDRESHQFRKVQGRRQRCDPKGGGPNETYLNLRQRASCNL